MKRIEDYPLWAAVLLPLILVPLVNLFPRPINVENDLTKSRIQLQRNHPGIAYDSLIKAAQALPWRFDLWENAGQAAWQAGFIDQAIAALEIVKNAHVITSSALLTIGDAYYKKGEIDSAMEVWEELADLPSPDIQILIRIENAYRERGEWQALIDTYQRHFKSDPLNASIAYRIAEVYALYAPEQSRYWANQAAQLSSEYASRTNTLIAGLTLAERQSDQAYRWTLLGRALGDLQTWDLASEAFQHAVMINPNYAEAWAFLGEARQQLGEDGEVELTRAEGLSPNSVLVQALQAIRWRRLGQPEKALAYLHAAAEQEPRNPIWQVELGTTLGQTGNLDEALKSFESATQINPQDPSLYRQLASFCVQYGYQLQTDGLEAARQAYLLEANNPSNLDILGQVYLRLGDFVSAERFFLRTLEISPDDTPALYYLGILYIQQNKLSQAEAFLRKAAAIQPDSPISKQAERLLQMSFP
jgi:tetratricopeptide (TPR) repeat protein